MNQKQDEIDEIYKTPARQQYVLIARNEINKILKYGNQLKKADTDERRLGLNLAKILIENIDDGYLKNASISSSWIYEVARIALKSINESSDLEKKVVKPFYSATISFSEIKESEEKEQLSEEHKESLETVGQLFERMDTIFGSEKLPEIYKEWENWFGFGKQLGWGLHPFGENYKTLEKAVLEEINIEAKV